MTDKISFEKIPVKFQNKKLK